jgi:hypothetical protein
MLRIERFLMIALLAVAVPAFAQKGGAHGGGGMGAGGGMGSGAGMGSTHGNSGDHSTGGSHDSGNASQHGSMSSQSPDQVLSHNTAIASKIKTLTGQDATTACSGFKNLGQCVAAAHVSKNLPGISFSDLKAKMTGSNPVSLGKAIQELKPSANSKSEAKKANKQAEQDINESSS